MKSLNAKAERSKQMAALLNVHFPKAFPLRSDGREIMPLKKNIHVDIANNLGEKGVEVSMTHIKQFLGYWCSQKRYLEGTVKANHRIDLQGNLGEEVDDSTRKYSIKRVKTILNAQIEKQKKKQVSKAGKKSEVVKSAPCVS